jgi:hypothetical protein
MIVLLIANTNCIVFIRELQKAIVSERTFNDRKVTKLKERCNFLEERLRKLELTYR